MTFTAHQNQLLYDRRVIFEAHSKIRLSGVPLEGKALVTITPHFIWPTGRSGDINWTESRNLECRLTESDYLWGVISHNVLLIDHTGRILWNLSFDECKKTSIRYYGAYYSDQRQKWVATSNIGFEYAINLEDGTLSESIFVGNR